MSDALKPGSAPTPTFATSPSSPMHPIRGMSFTAEKTIGVLHRIHSNVVYRSDESVHRPEFARCPACRNPRPLICPSCVATGLRLKRLREPYQELFRRKAAICLQIEKALQPSMDLQMRLFEKKRAIEELKLKIEKTQKSIQQIRYATGVTEKRIETCTTNNRRLKKQINKVKTGSMGIVAHTTKNEALTTELSELIRQRPDYPVFFTCLLLHLHFPVVRETLRSRSIEGSDEEGSSSKTKQWPAVKKHYFTIAGCDVNDGSKYERLESELMAGSPLVLSRRAQSVYAAIQMLIHATNTLALFIDLTLPYPLSLNEIATWSRWSPELWATDIFRLNTNVMALCAAFGIPNDQLRIRSPFGNLLTLTQRVTQRSKDPTIITTIDGILNEHMKHQIVEYFRGVTYEERDQEFTIEHVSRFCSMRLLQIEDDWESVDLL